MKEQHLWEIITGLKNSALKHRADIRPGRRRSGLQRYLKDVYRVYRDLRSRRLANKATLHIAKLLKLPVRVSSHPIRILIEASVGPEDNRAKSRWTQALKYAHGWLVPPEKLKRFFEKNGGVSGTAAKIPLRDGTTRPDNIRELDGQILDRHGSDLVGITPQANTAVCVAPHAPRLNIANSG
jgi:hypothetical protein